MKKTVLFFCVVFVSLWAWSQESLPKYNFVSIKEGMSKVGVSTIIQDDDGFIWFGTNGSGMYRYNGMDYNSYKSALNDSTSISSSLIYASFIDKDKNLWIGTEEGLNVYDKEKDRFKRIKISSIEDNGDNFSIRGIGADNKGNLFIGTFERGMFKLDLKTLEVKKIVSQSVAETTPISVYSILLNKNEKIYAATSKGVKEYDYNTNTLKLSKFDVSGELTSINVPIRTMSIDKSNTIWVGTFGNGLYRIETLDEIDQVFNIKNITISNNNILALISLPNGSVLCGSENNGLFHINAAGDVIHNYLNNKSDEKSILSNSIWSLFLDKNERIWLGYYNKGVVVYDNLYDKFENYESLVNKNNSLQTASVTALIKDRKDRLWVGMDGGGIDIIDEETNEFIHVNSTNNSEYKGLTNDYIEKIFIDSKDNIWAGSWNGGIYFLKKGSKQFINYSIESTNGQLASNIILSFAEDSKGTIWVGTVNGGLHSINPVTKKIKHHNSEPFKELGLDISYTWEVVVDKNDNIWVATQSGLFFVKENSDKTYTVILMADRMSKEFGNGTTANHILSLSKGANNNLWIGTRGAGLCKYDFEKDTFTWYNKLNGLEEENVSAIIESNDGSLWLSGNTGITKFDIANNTFTNYSQSDGLLSNDFNMNATYKDKDGCLYFGGYEGVDFFNPNKIAVNKNLPYLYLSELKIFNEEVFPTQKKSPLQKVISETDSITLNSRQSVFTLEYAGISYTRPEKMEYAYYLEGYEEDWNYVGEKRSATYTNLDSGDYTFKLKVANNDGIWNEKPLTLAITVLPPWWKTNWAISSYVLLFLLGIYLLNYITQTRIKEKQLISIERRKRHHEKELNEKKFQFFTNISHEFRTPLTLILNPLNDILSDTNVELPQRVKDKHKIIKKNTDRLYRLINELLDFRKLELNKVDIHVRELNLVAFIKDILSYFKEEAFVRNIQLTIDADLSDLPVWADQKKLEKIVFNIMSNAFKVTPDGGVISVDVSSIDKQIYLPLVDETNPVKALQISVTDTGPGLKKKQLQRIFERFYQVENLNKTYYGGTGIGLEVVKGFTDLHKGKIEVESKIGKGTCFKIIFPEGNKHFKEEQIISESNSTIEQNDNYIPTEPTIINKTETESDDSANYTLLIVEDNTELRNYLKEELKNDYRVIVANNGRVGLELSKEILPDIIMSDIIMPEMNGYDFCKNIKEDLRTSHIPLLILTAKARIDDRMEGIELGADAYMVKPFDMRLLKLRLSQLITSRQLIFNKYFSVISDVPENVNTTSIDKEFIHKVLNHINENIGDPDLSVESLAAQLHLSRSQFYRKIKALTNQTANEFLRNIRLQKAKQIIEMGNANISEVCYQIGFSSPSYFTKCFKNYFEMLPTEVKPNAN